MLILESIARYGYAEISSGSLRYQDTIPAMLDALRELNEPAWDQIANPAVGYSVVPAHALEDADSAWWDSEDADAVRDALHDALNEHAPEGYWFGANEGDGASFGFWPSEDDAG